MAGSAAGAVRVAGPPSPSVFNNFAFDLARTGIETCFAGLLFLFFMLHHLRVTIWLKVLASGDKATGGVSGGTRVS